MEPICYINTPYRQIAAYDLEKSENIDHKTVEAFGEEWLSFNQFSDKDLADIMTHYFDIVTPYMLNAQSNVIDLGCGSGRFIKALLPRAKHLVGLDPGKAILAADQLIGPSDKVTLIQADIDSIPFPDNHFDFAYSLGVLHHIPNTRQALQRCVQKVKKNGYFLLYLYYNLDNRTWPYRLIFRISDLIRQVVSRLPAAPKKQACNLLAICLYMPFVGLCKLLKKIGAPTTFRQRIPLFFYEDKSWYIIRNDALDRFGTPLEQRFSRAEIETMMKDAGLGNIVFSEQTPYWHAVGQKL